MFILTPIAISSSLTSKRAHVCIVTAIAASLAVSWDSSSFSSECSDRIPKRQRDGEGIETSTCTVFMRFLFSLHEYYLANPISESVRNCISYNISNFHENPTVDEIGIVVLLKLFWVFAGKEKATVRGVFLLAPTCFCISQRWECSELGCEHVAKFSRRSNGEWFWDHRFSETD